jgi:hypothetical protein
MHACIHTRPVRLPCAEVMTLEAFLHQLAHALGSLVDAEEELFRAGVLKALRSFEKSATIDPQNSLAWVHLARLEACNGCVSVCGVAYSPCLQWRAWAVYWVRDSLRAAAAVVGNCTAALRASLSSAGSKLTCRIVLRCRCSCATGNVERGMQVLEAVLDRDARCELALNAYALLLSEQLDQDHRSSDAPAHLQQQQAHEHAVSFDPARAHAIRARALQLDSDSVGARRLGAVLAQAEGGALTMLGVEGGALQRASDARWQRQRPAAAIGAVWEFAARCACVHALASVCHVSRGAGRGVSPVPSFPVSPWLASGSSGRTDLREAALPRAGSRQESTFDMLSDLKMDIVAHARNRFLGMDMRPQSESQLEAHMHKETAHGGGTCAADASTLLTSASPAHLATRDLTTTTQAHDSSISGVPQETPRTPSVSLGGEDGGRAQLSGAPGQGARSQVDAPGVRSEVTSVAAHHQQYQHPPAPVRSVQGGAVASDATPENRLRSPTVGQDEEYQQETWLCDEAANVLNLFDSATPGKSSESLSPSAVVDMIQMFYTPRSERLVAPALRAEASPTISVQRIQNGNLDRFRRSRLRACPLGSPRSVNVDAQGTPSVYMVSGQDLVNRLSPVATRDASPQKHVQQPTGLHPASMDDHGSVLTGSEQPHSNTRSWDTDFSMGADSKSSNKEPRELAAVHTEVVPVRFEVDAEESPDAVDHAHAPETPIAGRLQSDKGIVHESEPVREHLSDSERDEEPMEDSENQEAMLYDSVDASDAQADAPARHRDPTLAPGPDSLRSSIQLKEDVRQHTQEPKSGETSGWGVNKPAWRQVGLAKRLQRALARVQVRKLDWSTLDLGSLFASPGSSPAQRQAVSVIVASAALRFGSARMRQTPPAQSVVASSRRPRVRGRLVTPVPRGSRPILRRSLLLLGNSAANAPASAAALKRRGADASSRSFLEPHENVPLSTKHHGVVPGESKTPQVGPAEIEQENSRELCRSVVGTKRPESREEEEAKDIALEEDGQMIVDQREDEEQEARHAWQRTSFSQQELSDVEQALIHQSSDKQKRQTDRERARDEQGFTGLAGHAPDSQPVLSLAQVTAHENVATVSRRVRCADRDPATLSYGEAIGVGSQEDLPALSQGGNERSSSESQACARVAADEHMSAADTDPGLRESNNCDHSRASPCVLSHSDGPDGPASPQLASRLSPFEHAQGTATPSALATTLENESSLIRREQEWLAAHAESALAIDSYSRASPLLRRGTRAVAGVSELDGDSACAAQRAENGPDSAPEAVLPMHDSVSERRALRDEPFSLSMPRNALTHQDDSSRTEGETRGDQLLSSDAFSPLVHRDMPSACPDDAPSPLGAQQTVGADADSSFGDGHAERDAHIWRSSARPHTYGPGGVSDEGVEDDAGEADATEATGDFRRWVVDSADAGGDVVEAEAATPCMQASDQAGNEASDEIGDADADHHVRMLLPDANYYEAPHQTTSRLSRLSNHASPSPNLAAAQSEQPHREERGHAQEAVVYTALRGVAFRSQCSRADKHKIVDEAGKPRGVRHGQSILATRCDSLGKSSADGGWLHVTDGRFVDLSAAVFLPVATVVGEGLFVQVKEHARGEAAAPTGYGYRLGAREASVLPTTSTHHAATQQPLPPQARMVEEMHGASEYVDSIHYVGLPAAGQREGRDDGHETSAFARLQPSVCEVAERGQGEHSQAATGSHADDEDMKEVSDDVYVRRMSSESCALPSVRGDAAQVAQVVVLRGEDARSEQEGGARAGTDVQEGVDDEGTETLGGDGAANDDTQDWQGLDAGAALSGGGQTEETGRNEDGEDLSQDTPVWKGAEAVFASPSATNSVRSPLAAHMLAQTRASATPRLTIDFTAAGLGSGEDGERREVAGTCSDDEQIAPRTLMDTVMDRGDQGHAAGGEDAGGGPQVLVAGSATKCKDMTEEECAEAETQSEQQSEEEQFAAVAAQAELDTESEGWEEITDALSMPQDAGVVHALVEAQTRGEEDVVAVVEEQEGRGILPDCEAREVLEDDLEEVEEVEVLESAPSMLEAPREMEGNAAPQDEDSVYAEVWDEKGEEGDEEGDEEGEDVRAYGTCIAAESGEGLSQRGGAVMIGSEAPAERRERTNSTPPPPPHSPVTRMDEKAICALGRKQLQLLAKQHGIKANLKNAEIVAELRPLLSHAQPEPAGV